MEEDWNMLAADCVVISCCCQCLVLQILVLVLRKMVRKTREYGKKIFCQRKGNYRGVQREMGSYKDVVLRIQEDYALKDDDVHNCGCCMVEVEKVMEELCEKGEFGFGSFWGRKEPWGFPQVVNDHYDDSFVRYQIIDLGPT
ncbi:hypothetical protein MtrunA17_Chr8g0368671 [Medicago truncatula]|uniref:Transmembrane protein, putative n=1 Tax=Medicago truncatula TaxID=3880 RepID=A0A072TRR6_MEDTR|nr:uncharacterized protein LOC25501499 [Medicago truncatula]KEH20219.1 transmembrane protein, putative [Medicago truncatula]RHN41683.1 hypothetical protein MtrunA17_Chr8g0368671 [Medicago truncatula]